MNEQQQQQRKGIQRTLWVLLLVVAAMFTATFIWGDFS